MVESEPLFYDRNVLGALAEPIRKEFALIRAAGGNSWLRGWDLFPPAQRARPLALFMLGVPIGGAASYFFSGPTAQTYGWRLAMVIAAAPALVLVPLLLRLPEPVRRAAATHGKFAKPASVLAILKIPTIWRIIASGALLNFNMYAISVFLPAFLSRIHHLRVASNDRDEGRAHNRRVELVKQP